MGFLVLFFSILQRILFKHSFLTYDYFFATRPNTMKPAVNTTNIGVEESVMDQEEKDAPVNIPKESRRKGVTTTRVRKKLCT